MTQLTGINLNDRFSLASHSRERFLEMEKEEGEVSLPCSLLDADKAGDEVPAQISHGKSSRIFGLLVGIDDLLDGHA